MLSTAIFVYAATSPVNGYFGGSLYAKQGGDCQFSHTCTIYDMPFINTVHHVLLLIFV